MFVNKLMNKKPNLSIYIYMYVCMYVCTYVYVYKDTLQQPLSLQSIGRLNTTSGKM